MEQIQKSIEDILGCDDDTTAAILSRLYELGVTGVGDLVDVQVDDLTPSVLLPIPARKLIRNWSTTNNENHSSAILDTRSVLMQQQLSEVVVPAHAEVSVVPVDPVTPSSSFVTSSPAVDSYGTN